MNFKIDENLPAEVAQMLRSAGHDACTVADEVLRGTADEDIVAICAKENRVIVSLDQDFADITVYPPSQYPGFLVMRLKRNGKEHILRTFKRVLAVLASEDLENHLWIVTERRIRVWPA